jgi:geranylgeranyl pyrophosphate synthase
VTDPYAAATVAGARALVRELAPSAAVLRLLEGALAVAPPLGSASLTLALPRYVTAAVGGRDEPSAIGAIVALIDAGAHLLDDLHDGDAASGPGALSPIEIGMAAMALLGPIPQLAICQLPLAAATIVQLQAAMARGLLATGSGQHEDVRAIHSRSVSGGDAERAAAGKAGGRRAMGAELAALAAGATPAVAGVWAEFGRAVGTAAQLASDAADLCDPAGRDLPSGIRSYPIAATLERLTHPQREALLERIGQARADPSAAAEARHRLIAHGALLRTWILVRLHIHRARAALDRTGARGPARRALDRLLDGVAGVGAGLQPLEPV